MLSRASRDSKLYPYADPWDGQRGPFFERNWLPDMLSGLGGVTDDYASLTDHLDGMWTHTASLPLTPPSLRPMPCT